MAPRPEEQNMLFVMPSPGSGTNITDDSSMEHINLRVGAPVVAKKQPVVDEWDVVGEVIPDHELEGKPWQEMTGKERAMKILWIFVRVIIIVTSLYFFICSLSLLSSGFQLLGGKSAGEIFAKGSLLNNPIIGLMIGVLVTVLVQSSSTSTSIIVAMVSAGIVTLKPAICMIMGANIGTTVTNTIVSLGQSMDRKMFRRAFAGATVHDCFNWLCVCIFLPLEVIASPLERLSSLITTGISDGGEVSKLDFLKVLTKPLTKRIISIDKDTIKDIAKYCTSGPTYNDLYCSEARNASMMKVCDDTNTMEREACDFLFSKSGLNDTASGVILLLVSLFVLCTCLTILVKTLQSLLMGRMAQTLKRHINTDLPRPWGWFTGYIFIVVGMGMTILVQSSSVFTSTITPLVGMGVISIDRMFPLTLGSNIGTTATAILAALAATGDNRALTIQVAMSHLMFNIFGIAVFYPIPWMRQIPLSMAKCLGNTTANYRWFAVVYLILMFLVLPLSLILLSFNVILLYTVLGVVLFTIVTIVIVTTIQRHRPAWLPGWLRTWKFLPRPLRSMDPYDRVITGRCGCFEKNVEETPVEYPMRDRIAIA